MRQGGEYKDSQWLHSIAREEETRGRGQVEDEEETRGAEMKQSIDKADGSLNNHNQTYGILP